MSTKLLEEILTTRSIVGPDGTSHHLHSEVTQDEGRLLQDLVRDGNFRHTLEIGCAFGISSLFICEALRSVPGAKHTVLDPGQYSEWKGIGLHNIRSAGFDFVEFLEQPSELVLPRFVAERRAFDLVLIDGLHTFDQTLVDFYYSDRLLRSGGVIVLDDLQLPAVRKVARFIQTLPSYRVKRTAKPSIFPPSRKRRLLEAFLRLQNRAFRKLGMNNLFDPSLERPDYEVGLVSEMVAFEKVESAPRDSHWHVPF